MSSLASSYPHRVAGGAVVGGGAGGGGYGGVSGNAFHNESLSRYGGHDALMASRYGNEHGLFAGGGGVGVGGGGYGVSEAGGGLGSSYFGGIPSYTTPPSSHPQYHQMIDQNQARWGNTAVNGLIPGQNPNISHLEASLGGGGGIKRSLDDVYLSVDGLYKRTRMETGNNLPVYPQRPGEKDCAFYMKTRNCKFGGNCKFDHPAWVPAGGIPDWKEAAPPKTLSLPVRTGEPDCVFYMKYGSCKFGENCKFNHPQDRSAGSEGATSEQNGMDEDKVTEAEKEKNTTLKPASQFNAKGLPVRPGETDCPFYMKKGSCKYGSTCRFNHPDKPASVSVPVQQMSMDTLAALSGGGLVGLPGFGGLTGGLPGGVFGGLSGLAGGLGHHQYIGASPDFGLAGLGMGPVGNLTINPAPYPQRPGEQECSYYMKTGICKYGVGCKFNHPINRTEASQPESKLTLAGLPRREGETTCAFYLKTGACKYGANCRFDHPPPGEVVAKALADAKKTDEDEDEEAGEEDQSS